MRTERAVSHWVIVAVLVLASVLISYGWVAYVMKPRDILLKRESFFKDFEQRYQGQFEGHPMPSVDPDRG